MHWDQIAGPWRPVKGRGKESLIPMGKGAPLTGILSIVSWTAMQRSSLTAHSSETQLSYRLAFR